MKYLSSVYLSFFGVLTSISVWLPHPWSNLFSAFGSGTLFGCALIHYVEEKRRVKNNENTKTNTRR